MLKPGPVSGAGLCAQMGPLESKFPFSPQATLEATPQDLAGVFDPNNGALSQFYNSALKNLLLPQGTGYIANPSATQAVNPAFLDFFNRATGVQRALYSGAPGQLQFKYALRPHPTESVSSLSMNIDGQALSYYRRQFLVPAVYVAGNRPGRHAYGEDCRWVRVGIPQLQRNLGQSSISLPMLTRLCRMGMFTTWSGSCASPAGAP